MTLLGEKIKQLKEADIARRVECGTLMRDAAKKLAEELSELFDDTLTDSNVSDESALVKAVTLKQPTAVCVIDERGAELRVDLSRYKNGMLKDIDDVMRGAFLDTTAWVLQEKYPEYRFRRNGSSIMITEPPPPPMSIMEWMRSLVKPRKLI